MKLTTITVHYGVKRSGNFQSVDCGADVTMELAEGENKTEAVNKVHDWLSRMVNAQADAALDEVLNPRQPASAR